ncbi:MAG: hypothetical protein V1648_00990 [Candidatus Aenigmatarchaeota archaeon]
MDFDWIIGVFVFMVFIGWSFSYYFAMFQVQGSSFELAADSGQQKVMDFLAVDVYEAPVKYYSSGTVADGVLKAKSLWYAGERNSTIVFGGGSLPCRLDGNDVYWQANVGAGYNYYTIMFADVNTTLNCTGTFATTGANLTSPWALEKREMISTAKISEMEGMSYSSFRNGISLRHNFMITIEKTSGNVEYGKAIPSGPVNVNSRKTERKVFETGELANITIAVW